MMLYLAEKTILATYMNRTELQATYRYLHRFAAQPGSTFETTRLVVQQTLGEPLSAEIREYLNWEYLTAHFFDEKEQPPALPMFRSIMPELSWTGEHGGTYGLGRL